MADSNVVNLINDIRASQDDPEFKEHEISLALKAEAATYSGLGIKLLSIVGGLLGSLFFLGFIILSTANAGGVQFVLGAGAFTAAIIIDRKIKNTILDAICIGTYLASLTMLGNGLMELKAGDSVVPSLFLIIAALTPLLTSGFMLNFFAVLLFNGSLFALININREYELMNLLTAAIAAGYMFFSLYESKLLTKTPAINIRFNAIKNGLLYSLMGMLIYLTLGLDKQHQHGFLTSAAVILLIGILLYYLLNYHNTKGRREQLFIVLSLLALLPTIFAPAISGAILIVLVSFHTGHKTGLAAGILGLIYFTGKYYYDLDYSLLVKSEIMFASGILLFIAWFIFKKQLKRYEKH